MVTVLTSLGVIGIGMVVGFSIALPLMPKEGSMYQVSQSNETNKNPGNVRPSKPGLEKQKKSRNGSTGPLEPVPQG